MSNFQELVKNLYTSKNRELTEEKLQYIEKNYKDKEQDFVKNFYTTIGEELTEEKFNYINDKYLKKKENTNSQSSVGSSVSQKPNESVSQAKQPTSPIGMWNVIQDFAKPKPYAQQPTTTIVGDNSQITTADPFGVYGQGSASQQRAKKVVYTPERSYEINQDLVKRKDDEIRALEKTIEINKGSYLPNSNGGINYNGIEKDLQRLEALKKEREGLAKIADKSLENVKPEIESISKSAIKENLSNFTTKGKSSKGEITVPNQQAIIKYADKEAEKRGLEKGGYYSRLIQNQLSGEVAFKIIEPKVNQEFETIFEKRNGVKVSDYKTVPQKSQEILIKNGEQLKAQHKLSKDKVLSSIKSEYQPEYSAVENQYKTNIDTIKIAQESDVELQTLLQQQSEQLGVKYQQEVNSGKLSVEEATRLYNEEYNQIATKTYNDKYLPLFGEAYNEYLNQFNGINKKLNQRAEREISELNRVFGDKLKSINNELKSIPNKDPEFDTKVQLAYKEAYNKVLKENHQELNQGEQGWGAFGAGWRSFKSSLGSSLKDISSALGFRDLEAYWASMETENVSIPEPIKQASDLLDLSKVLKGTGQLGGTMLPTMLPAVAVTLATGGTATGALLGAGVSFMSETIMMSESVKQDVFAETGSVAKAEQASTEMVKSQLENMWTYSLDMLPFTNWLSKPLRGINKAVSIPLRFGINAGIEVGTETIQEFKQGAAEQSILKYGVRDFASEFETPQALKETFFTVTPTALFGGLGQIKSISNELITERKVGNNMATIRANAIIAQNMGANGMNQYVSNMVNEQGADYTSVAIQNMYKEGLISKEILDQSLQTIDRTEKSISTATSLGLDKGQAKVFNAITEDINSARQELANAYSQFAKNILEDRIKQLEREASTFANTGKTERAVLTLQNGQQYIATAENLANMLHNEEFAQSVENGDVQVNMDGAEKMGMYDIYLNSIGTPKLESVADKIRNNETLTPSEKIIYDRNKSEIDRYNKNMESENKSESTKQSPADTKQEEVKVKQEPKAEQEQTQKPQEYKIEELADKEVEYNGEKGTLSIDEGGKVTIETEDAIYEVNANSTDNAFENNIVYNEEYVPKTIEVQDENNISLDGENYTIITDDKGNITQLKGDNGNVIENQDVLIQAEVQRNKKLDNPRIEQAIENDTEVAVQEIKSVSPNTEVVDNLLNYNMTDNVSDALDKLYDGEELTEQEALSSELYISDAIERLEKLKSERPELSESVDRVINGLYNASNILDKVKQNGKRKSAKATKKEAKQTTNKPTVSEPKPRGEETVTREEVKVSPADNKIKQPKSEGELAEPIAKTEEKVASETTPTKPKETKSEAKVEPKKEAPKEKVIDEAKQTETEYDGETESDVNAEAERTTPEESGRDTKEKPKEITKPKNKQELADKIRDVFGLSKKKAQAVADIIGLSAKSLVKAGVFNSEKEFWDSLPEFSKEKPENISDDQYQSAKGVYSSIKNMIYNLTGGDVSTVLHEVSHWWLDNIDRSAIQGNKQAKAMQFTLDNFAKSAEGIRFWKANFGGKFDAKNYKYRQELFARSYERYLYDGVAPTPKLKQIFDDISQWFKEIYASLADIDINLSDGMRSLYGKILSYDEVQLVEDDFVQQSESEIKENLSENIKSLDALNEELSDFDAFDLFQNNSEIEQIKQKAISDGTFMKAPNGKPTNLNERQWLQVRSKAFISWFGDWQNDTQNASKVVDENGEPMVVYHGTDAHIDVFDLNKIVNGEDVHKFITNPEIASVYGKNVIAAFLSIKNSVVGSKFNERRGLAKFYIDKSFNDARLDLIYNSKRASESQGGVAYGVLSNDLKQKGDVYFVHDSNQIKSATDNIGTFDNTNPNILFQARQNERQQAVDNIQKWADVAKGKNPNIKKSEFIEILKNNSTTKKIFDYFTEKEVGDIFANTEVDTSLFDEVVNNSQENVTNGTSERRYISRVIQDAESLGFQEYMDEVEKLEGKADRISQEAVEKIAEKLFQSMLNADNIDVAFLAFLNYASTRVFSAKEGSILPTMSAQVFHKIIAYYKQNGDIKNAKRWIELFSGSGRALGQFISAMQESSTPEAIANKITDKIAEENNKALDKVQDGGKTGKEIMESTAETLKTTKEESKNLVDNGKKTNEAKNKAVSKSRPSKKAIKDTELSDTQKKSKESAKAKAKSFFEIAKGEGLFQISGKLKDIAKGVVDDILDMGAKSKEIAFATYSSIMEEQGVPSEIISESFNEVWSADQDTKVKDNMSDYIAEKVISGSKTKPKKVTDKTNPLDMVANVLIARATEIIPESARQTAKKTIPAIERLAELIKNKEIAESAWRKAMNEVRNQIEVNPMLTDMEKAEMIAQLEDDISNFMSKPLPKSLVRKAVKTGAKDLGIEIDKVIQESLESQTETGNTIAKNLIEQLGLDADTAQELQDAVMEDWNDMLSEAKERALEIQLEKDLKKKVRDADLARKRADRQAELERKRAEREREKAELKAERDRLREIERQNKINEKERKKAEERIKKLVGLINNPKPNTSKGKDLIDNIMEAVNGGVLDDAVLKQAFENQFGLRTLTPEQETKLRNFVKLLSTDLGIEYKGRIARDFADFLKSLEPRTAVAIYEFLEGAIVSMSLSGLVTNTLNIPVGTASMMSKSYVAKLATSPIGMWNAIQDFAKTNQSGIGRSASKSALKTGYNQLADINEVFSNEPRIKGSLNRYIFNNIGERKQKLDDRLDKSAQKKNAIARALFMAGNFYYEANITALSLFQAVINLNSAFDPLLANRLGEYYNYVNLYNLEVEKNKQNKLNKTRGEILDSVREKMGYNQIQQDIYTQKAQDIARILSSYGIELSDAFIQREAKWQMLASREQEVVEQAYEEVSNASMMGKPYGVFGMMLEKIQKTTQYNRNPETKLGYIGNVFKFMARVNLMLFSRVATMSLNTAIKAIPLLGSLNSFYTLKPNKNGKWDFQLNSKEEIRRNLIGDAAILATYVGLLAHMFDWDDEEETFVLSPNRLIDMTLDVGAITKDYKRGDLEEDYTPLAIRVRTSSDKEFKRWQGVKYGLPIIPIVAMLGGLSDRINYKTSTEDYKEEHGDNKTTVDKRKKYTKKDLLVNAYPDVARALSQLSFNQTLRTIGDVFTMFGLETSADTRERKFTDIVANTSKPYKQLVVPFTSNISRDIINITASYLDVEQPKYTKVEKIFLNGFALADFVTSASRSEDRVVRDRFGNKLPRQTFMHQLTYAVNTLPFIDIENEGIADLQKKTIYQIINSKEHEGMAVPKEISISSTNFGKILKNRDTPENLKIQVLNEMSKEWGRRIEEKLGDGKWKDMTEDEIYAIMYRERTKAREYIEKVGYETINGKSVKIHKNLYKINPKLYLEIFPEYSNK